MTVALRSPELVSALIPVDNAPVNAVLKSDFPKYVRGMQEIENAKVTKQSDANKILEAYEEVNISVTTVANALVLIVSTSLCLFVNSFSRIW